MSDETEAQKLRARRWVALWVLFFIAVIVDLGLGLSEAMCENCGGPAGSGQHWAVAISGGSAFMLSAGCALRGGKGASVVLAMIAAILWLHWLLILAL